MAKKNLLVTLANRQYVNQAKQLFSSVYWNSGWKGDYMLLAHKIPEKELKWFRKKGILVKKCKPLSNKRYNFFVPVMLDKFYLFTPEFKKWKTIVYLDADIIVRASLDDLTKVKGFAAPKGGKLKEGLVNQNKGSSEFNKSNKLLSELKADYNFDDDGFNSGVMAINTSIIKKDIFKRLKDYNKKYKKIAYYGDQSLLNLFFYKKWEELHFIYNSWPKGYLKKYKIRSEEIQGAIIHFAGLTKPWNPKSAFHSEWKSNLRKAEQINLGERNIAQKKWGKKDIAEYLLFLKKRGKRKISRRVLPSVKDELMEKKMKIAIFHNFMDNIGGAEYVDLILARELNADIYTTNIDEEKIAKMGFSDILPRIKSIGRIPINAPFRQEAAYWKFRRLNLGKKYNFYIIAGDWAMSAAIHNKPHLWYVYSPMREIWDLYEYTRKNSVRPIFRPIFDLWVRMRRIISDYDSKKIKNIIAISKNVRHRVKKYLNRDAQIIYPPTETSKYYNKKSGDYWLSVNRLIAHKRVDVQLKAFAKMPNKKLIIVGSYEKGARHFEKYAKYCYKIKPDNVQIKNWASQEELLELYANCRGFITTALEEDYGMTPIEAMASGKPVIASNEGGYKETILHEKTGMLIEDINSEKLVEAVRTIEKNLKENPDKYKNACIKQARRFDTKIFIEKIKGRVYSHSKKRARFIIIATPRSGSNFLANTLNSHPEIKCYGEVFNLNADSSFKNKTLEENKEDRRTHPLSFANRLWSESEDKKAAGFKIMTHQSPEIILHVSKDDQIKKIVLIRKNILKQYVSLKIAEKTDIWQKKRGKDERHKKVKVKINIKEFYKWITKINKDYITLLNDLRKNGRNFIVTYYEDITGPKKWESYRKLLKYLNVTEDSALLNESNEKQNPEDLRLLVSNFKEIKEKLKNTNYEWMVSKERPC
jgi:glycosyltransferase involved in cell wall biosynthesis/LPS sulfotransferase NodH